MKTKKRTKMPSRLTGAAADKWKEIAPTIVMNTPMQIGDVVMYCEQWAIYCDAMEAFNKSNRSIVTEAGHGNVGESVFLKTMRSALDQMTKIQRRFEYMKVEEEETKKEW